MSRFTVQRPQDFGQFVADRRRELGVSQEELADRLGFSRSYLSEMESGEATMQMKRLMRVMRELGMRIELEVED